MNLPLLQPLSLYASFFRLQVSWSSWGLIDSYGVCGRTSSVQSNVCVCTQRPYNAVCKNESGVCMDSTILDWFTSGSGACISTPDCPANNDTSVWHLIQVEMNKFRLRRCSLNLLLRPPQLHGVVACDYPHFVVGYVSDVSTARDVDTPVG